MNIKEKDIELIERYLDGNLKGPDYLEFNRRIEKDSEFRKSLEEMETMVSGIRYTGRRQIIDQLERLEAGLPKLHQAKEVKLAGMRRIRTWAAAASILLIAVTALWFFSNRQMDQQDLFTTYYQPYPNVESPTTRSLDSRSIREEAYYAYDREQYQQAVELFMAIDPSERKAIDNFYQALSHLSIEEALQAESLLKQYLVDGDQLMLGKARWYLALAYLSQGKTGESLQLLQNIVEEESHGFKKASRLLEELK